MNTQFAVNESLWIDKTTDCILNGGTPSPFFIPKISEVMMEFDNLVSSSFGMCE
jgi:hypothetical protein